MRCQKCGFISFDYLSSCRKCGIDLVTVRESLGLLGIKPSIPFYLGSILASVGTAETSRPTASAQPSELEFPEMEFGDEMEFEIEDETAPSAESVLSSHPSASVTALVDDPDLQELEALVDRGNVGISNGELEKSLRSISHEMKEDFQMEVLTDKDKAKGLESLATPAPSIPEPPKPAPLEPLEFSLGDDLDKLDDFQLEIDFDMEEKAAPAAAKPAFEPPKQPEKAPVARPSLDDNFLHLSDDELGEFLMEIDDTPAGPTMMSDSLKAKL